MSEPNIRVYGRPEFIVTLNKEEVQVLFELANTHYSLDCKALALPMGRLSVLRRELTRLNAQEIAVHLSFRELDLLTKVLELRTELKAPFVADRAQEMDKAFRKALTLANALSITWAQEVL